MQPSNRHHHNAHALRPQLGELGLSPLDELARSVSGPDDVPIEIDDLAEHFLLEATQAPPSSAPEPAPAIDAPEASMSEACFEGEDGRAGQRAFERLWREIISRELG